MVERIYLTREEIVIFKKILFSRLGKSAHGLLYVFGREIGKNMLKIDKIDNIEDIKKMLKKRNLIEDIFFEGEDVIVIGSGEVGDLGFPNCDVLRGILSKMYEAMRGEELYCKEVECVGAGHKRCVFKIENDILE
mgnify:CR=1 FL=1